MGCFFEMAQKRISQFAFEACGKSSQLAKNHETIALTMQKNYKEFHCDPSCMASMSEDFWHHLEGERAQLQRYIAAGRRGDLNLTSRPSAFFIKWRLTYVASICNLAFAHPFPADEMMYTRFGNALDTCTSALTAAQLYDAPNETTKAARDRARLFLQCMALVELVGAFDRVLRRKGNPPQTLTGSALTVKANQLFDVVCRQVARDVDNS